MADCTNCGSTLADGAAFCTTCGTPSSGAAADAPPTTPNPIPGDATQVIPPGGAAAPPPGSVPGAPFGGPPPGAPLGAPPPGAPSFSPPPGAPGGPPPGFPPGPGGPPPGGPVPAGGGKSSKAPLFIILGLVALVFLAVAAGAVLLITGSDDGDDDEARVTTTQPDDDETTTTEDDDETTTTEDGEDPPSSDLPDPEPPGSFDDPAFDALAETCEDGDLAACDILFAITPVGSEAEAYGATCGGRNEEIPAQCAAEYEWELPEAQAPGALGDDATFDGLASDCESGDLAACDDLYAQTPVDSAYEAYGRTCGGRLPVEASDELSGFQCVTRYGEAS